MKIIIDSHDMKCENGLRGGVCVCGGGGEGGRGGAGGTAQEIEVVMSRFDPT